MAVDFFQTVGGTRFVNRIEQFCDDYHKSLIKSKPFDWTAFRAEAAKSAMQAIVTNGTYGPLDPVCEMTAKAAVEFADALIAELKKTPQ